MSQRKISLGPLVGLLGALLLLVSLFLDWWEGITAFTAFEVLDLVLAGLALAAMAALADAAGARVPAGVRPGAGAPLPIALVALLIVVTQLLNDPPAVAGGDQGPDLGIWLGLAGALLMLAGCLLAVARISVALDLERRERATGRDRPADPADGRDRPAQAADTRDAPPPPASEAPTRAEPERPA